MSDDRGPGTGNVVAGIFLILFGLCLALLGGGCTLLMLSLMTSSSGGDGAGEAVPLILISAAVLGAGVVLIWVGIKLMTGGFNKPR